MEKNSPHRSKQKKKQKGDWFLTVSLVQLFFCAFLCLIVFVCAKTNGKAKESLREDFSALMQWNLETEYVQNAVALVREYFSSSGDTLPVFGAFSFDVDETDETTLSSASTEAPTAQPTTEPKKETTTAQAEPTTEKKAKNESANGVGGEDVTALSAQENTSFSPTAVTVPIVRPVRGGRYSSGFGYRTNPITHVYSFHTGLDIAVAQGTKIHAAYHGQVRAVGEDTRSGKYIILRHDDGFETFYCHCSRIDAAEGDTVDAGDVIARVGSTGWSTGPHLHFEVRKNGKRLDPLQFLEDDA